MKKLLAIILCAAMLLLTLAACTTTNEESESDRLLGSGETETYAEEWVDEPSQPSDLAIDLDNMWDAAFATFAPDTVMISAGEHSVVWSELFFHLRNMLQNFGGENPAEAAAAFGDMILADVADSALAFRIIEFGAAAHNVELDAEAIEEIQASIDMYREMEGLESEEALRQNLWETMGYYSVDTLRFLLEKSYLAQVLMHAMYGENGADLSDDAVREAIENEGYLMSMHILVMEHDDPTAEAARIHALLEAYTGDDFTAHFAELMFEYSEDLGGLQGFPTGYVFQAGDMVPEFYEGTKALEIGGLSAPIRSQFGYHIIHRLPIDYDVVPISMQGQMASLRHIVAMESFDVAMDTWLEELNPQFTPAFESIDLAAMFAVSD